MLCTPQNKPSEVEYFFPVLQKGKLKPGGIRWFAQVQTAFAPNSLLQVLDHISIFSTLPGQKAGLEAQGIHMPTAGVRRGSSPAGAPGNRLWRGAGKAVSSLLCNSPWWRGRHFAHVQELPKVEGLTVKKSRALLILLTSQESFTYAIVLSRII